MQEKYEVLGGKITNGTYSNIKHITYFENKLQYMHFMKMR